MLSSSPSCSIPTVSTKKKTTQKKEKKEKKKGEKGGESTESNEALRKTQKITKKDLWKIYDSEQDTSSNRNLEIQSTAPYAKPKLLLSSSLPVSLSQYQTTEKEDPSTEEADLCSHCQQLLGNWWRPWTGH
jgi:hypothetical protein